MKGKWKRRMAMLLAGAVAMTYMPAGGGGQAAEAASGVPAPIYSWEFESGQVDGRMVRNAGSAAGSEASASLHAGAAVAGDSVRGSVLTLPGGPAGTGGWLTLPSTLYGQVDDQLTIMMWANVAPESGAYTRLFSSTINEKGLTYNGVGNWSDPEFSLVTGGDTYNHRIYTGSNAAAAASYKGDVVWDESMSKGTWQHVAVSMHKNGSYKVYVDGEEQAAGSLYGSNSSAGATMASVLDAFFQADNLAALTFNDFGRSLYQSDADVKGSFDDIRFYNVSLSGAEVKAAYDQYFAPEPDQDLATSYTFESVNGKEVANDVSGGAAAVLGDAASVVVDDERGKVLSLPGGAANAGSWLTLPGDLFAGVNGDDGFAISLWLKVPAGAADASYTRLFAASPYALGGSEQGYNRWMDPELALVRGGGDYNARLFNGIAANRAAGNGVDIHFDRGFKTDQWQHVVLTMNKSSYDVYLDGQPVANVDNATIKRFAANSIGEALPSFFEANYPASLVNNALGRSLYTSDRNFTGLIDDFAFYKRHLTASEVAALSGIGDMGALNALIGAAEQLNGSGYTEASYAHLQAALSEAIAFAAGQQHPTQGAIDEQQRKLQAALDGLKEKLPDTLKPDYFYSFDASADNQGKLANEGSAGAFAAALQKGAQLRTDAERGQVLNLPGGSNGEGGWLDLPGNLFEDVTQESGFTAAMWVNLHSSSHSWSRLFDAGSANYGSGSAPFFYVSTQNGSEVNTGGGKQYMNGYTVPKSAWAHVAYTVKDGVQTAYVNGIPVKTMEADKAIFALARQFDKNAVGRSRFSADPDLRAQLDDVMFFKKALDGDGVMTLVGQANNSMLRSVAFAGKTQQVAPGTLEVTVPLDGISPPASAEQITLATANPAAKTALVKLDTSSYRATVTSANGKMTSVYTLRFFDNIRGATANFRMTQSTGPIMHGASGFLYGISEPNVPTIDLLSPLKPKVIVQKAPGGLQHPSGDGVRISDAVLEAGVEQIQIYIQDMYYQWPYEYKGLEQYEELAVETVLKSQSHANSDKFVYVIFNEPDQIWFGGKMNDSGFYPAWKRIYDAVKQADPGARIAGPNVAGYNVAEIDGFMRYCKANNCIPDVVTWHELPNDNGAFEKRWDTNYNHYRSLEQKYDIPEKQIVINEYAWFEDPGAAGSLIQWLARFEEKKVYGSIAYWHLANSLNELAADANKPNGAWWLYKWYADMSGDTVKVETSQVKPDGMYGLASIDAEKKTAYALFGGEDGVLTSSLKELAEHEAFKDADSVHVKLYRTKFTGYYGMQEAPVLEYDGDMALIDGALDITVNGANALDGFLAIVTPATGKTDVTAPAWSRTYEAELAAVSGAATASGDASPVSGWKYVDRIGVGDSVTFDVDVPQAGLYRLDIYYGNNARTEGGRNRAQGDLAKQSLTVDGGAAQELVYASTIFNDYFSSKTVYIDLAQGAHTIKLTGSGGMDASLDKLDLSYAGASGSDPLARPQRYEAEEAQLAPGLIKGMSGSGFSSGGYAEGEGEAQFTVVVPVNGYYKLTAGYAADSAAKLKLSQRIVRHAEDASADAKLTIDWSPLGEYALEAGNEFQAVSGISVYLAAGANALRTVSDKPVKLDYLELKLDREATANSTTIIEAEAGKLFGEAKIVANDSFSGGRYVDGIGKSRENGLTLTVQAESAGRYKLAVDYSNNEPAPPIVTAEHPNGYIHPYNSDLVERYAQIAVNDGKPQTVYFINTLAWNATRNVVVDIELKKGANTITLYNDNSYRFSDVVQYAPYFDRFSVAPAALSEGQTTEEPGTNPGGGNSGGGNAGNGGGAVEGGNPVLVIADGKATQLQGRVTLSETAGRKSVLVELEDDKVIAWLEQNEVQTLTISAPEGTAEATVVISPKLAAALGERGVDLEWRAGRGVYVLPAKELRLERLARLFGEQAAPESVGIRISVSEPTDEQARALDAAKPNHLALVAAPLDFKVEAVYDGGKEMAVVHTFSGYVLRKLVLPQGAESGSATGVVLTEEGKLAHAPTRFVEENGRIYAYISSTTNSLYAVVSGKVSFADLTRHWSKAAVERLASRLIVSGVSAQSFMPDRSVSRAEFAAMLIRGLGLRGDGAVQASEFPDVAAEEWYASPVRTAAAYGLMHGYEDGTFRPERTITREEMAVMLNRALELAGAELPAASGDALAAFADEAQLSGWARGAAGRAATAGLLQGFNGKLAPKAQLSRAEAAVAINRLLVHAKLIDQ